MELGTILIAVSMMNFSLGFLLCLLLVPFAILIKPKDPEGVEGKRYVLCISIKFFSQIFPFII